MTLLPRTGYVTVFLAETGKHYEYTDAELSAHGWDSEDFAALTTYTAEDLNLLVANLSGEHNPDDPGNGAEAG